ncbi:TraB/GumN family protein [Puniceibacterium confluentis]|uniref:TraB/GumN family protein n=1 Tax=Puniceibacterium confluentis TaxID=1958944 RepID=UPI0011B7EE9C|nr:TraB/GumN family protein [Puniceibacterium confluentis]
MRLLVPLFLCLGLATTATAQCAGQDLRETLTDAERGELHAIVAETAFPVGNRWRAMRGSQQIDLIGTVHLDDPRLDAPAARIAPEIGAASAVLLEMSAAQQAELTAALTSRPEMLLLTDTTLPELMDEAAWQTLAEAARARGVPAVMAAKFQPWYLSMLLSIPPCATAALQQAQGLDGRILDIALAADVPTQSLESFDTVFNLFKAAPLEEQIAMMQAALVAPQTSEDLFATLLASYFEEALTESWQVSRLLSRRLSPLDPAQSDAMFAQMQTDMLDNRNRAWIPVILKAVEEGPIVVAVGAAHLQGDTGLLNLLEARGFTLTRQRF